MRLTSHLSYCYSRLSIPLLISGVCSGFVSTADCQIAPPITGKPSAVGRPSQPGANSAPGQATNGPALLSGQGAPTSAPQGLALADALAMAQQRSFVSQQYDARVAGAAARLTGAGRLLNPVLSVGGHAGKNTGGTDEDILLSESFELGDKRNQRVRAARAERDAATFDRLTARNDLAYNVQSAYYEAQRAEAERQLAQDALANARKFAEAAQIQFTAGDVARSQVTRSRIEQNRAEQTLTVAETERVNRLATLRSLLRMPTAALFSLPNLPPFAPVTYKLEDLETYALAHRPDLQSAQYLRAGKEALLHGARAQSQPDLFVEARHANIDPTQGGNTVRAGLLFPLYDFGRGRADATSAKAALSEQEAVLAELKRTALLDVDTAYRNLEQARRTVEAFRGGRLDSSKELLDQAQIGYSQGAASFLELLDAQQVYRAEQTDYTRALAAYNIALAALQRAVGGQLP